MLQEFRRIKGNITSMKEHAELLTSVREDISEYKVRRHLVFAYSFFVQVIFEGIIVFLEDLINKIAGIWISQDAVTTGESCHTWKHISRKI